MDITEANETVRLLRHLDGSQPNASIAGMSALYLADRASQTLQVAVQINEDALVDSLVEVER